MKSYIPLKVKSCPIRRLALIPFEKNPDSIYRGFELQYMDGEPNGTGYRVIAYRNDNYVDVYDDESLYFIEDEKFDVAENGLHKHVQTCFTSAELENVDGKQMIAFSFTDIENREVEVYIEEKTNRATSAMDLLAPIGVGSQNPNFLPVFFMYRFDFVRRKKTEMKCRIGDNEISIDKFPIPMDNQFRWYARYSNECELFEFASDDVTEILEAELVENVHDKKWIYHDDAVDYIFEQENILQNIVIHFGEENVQIDFQPGLDCKNSCNGIFTIKPREQMGYIQGEFKVQMNEKSIITIIPTNGWVSRPTTFLTKMILGEKSVFQNWSKKYKYESVIDWKMNKMKCHWTNGNAEKES